MKPDEIFTGLGSLKRSIWSAGRYVMQLADEKVADGNDDYDLPKMLDRSRSLQAEALTFVGQKKSWVVLLFVCREFHRHFIILTPPEDYLYPFQNRTHRLEFNSGFKPWHAHYTQLLHVLKVNCPVTLIDDSIARFSPVELFLLSFAKCFPKQRFAKRTKTVSLARTTMRAKMPTIRIANIVVELIIIIV